MKTNITPSPTWPGSTIRLVSIPVITCIVVLSTADAAQPPRYVEGELLVKFAEGTRGPAAERARQAMKHDVRRNFDFIGWQQIRLPRGMGVEEGLARYRQVPGVLAVEPNYIAEGPDPGVDPVPLASGEAAAALVPNDPGFAAQYGLAKIQATNAWEVSTGDSNIVVAIIDSGINYDHEDLAPHMWRNPGEIPANGLDDDANGYVDDVYGIDTADDLYGNDTDPRDQGIPAYHGSACAGIIGALSNNGLGIAGLNWNIQLMALRFIKTNNTVSAADRLEAFQYVALMKDRGVSIKVISMSFGGTIFQTADYEALIQITSRGILGAAAAMNSTNDNDIRPYYPASYDIPGIVAVAATDQNDNLATFSNWGHTNVDLAAPGVGILMPGGPGAGAYWIGSGTSQATPHVAGAAALLFATYPNATPEEVKLALLETVDLIPALTNRVVSHGRLNVGRAIVHSDLNSGPPVIYREPQNQLAVLNHSATFSAGVRGKSPLHYQWRFGSSLIPGATNSILVLNNTTLLHEGEYSVIVTNPFGIAVSRVAVLTITPLLITTHPRNQAVRLGSAATFSVAALSPETPTYQWHFEGSPLSGATSSNLTVTNVQFADEGFYSVVVSNSYIAVTSAPARLTVLLGPAQHAYVKASNPGGGDNFGVTLAISGDTMVIGAPFEDSGAIGVNGDQNDNSATNSGAAYVFVRDGDTWVQQAYLKAPNTGGNDQFGAEVAISGDTIVVGAPFEDSGVTGVNGNQNDNSATNSGAAYVFVRDGDTWVQQAYLKASNTGGADNFGFHVAVADDTVVVGAWLEDSGVTGVNGNQSDNSAANSGAAYVFVRTGTTWTQQAYLKASNTGAGDQFGVRVSVSGETVVVSANFEDSGATGVNGNQNDNSASNSGAAYIFVRNGTTWTQEAYLKASNTGAGDEFGWAPALSGDTIAIGARLEDSGAIGVNGDQNDNSALDSGAAYVFVRNGTTWTQQAYLKASNAEADDRFGRQCAISGDTVVVGAWLEDSGATGVNGNQSDNILNNAGAAYVFVRDGTTWTQQAYLKASNSGVVDQFGAMVTVSGDTVVASANLEDSGAAGVNGNQNDDSALDSGAAYVFTDLGPERPPLIVVQPRSQTILLGHGATLRVEASGKNPLAYQWYFNSAPLPYATNRFLALSDLGLDASGDYAVVVTNVHGSVTSRVAVLTVSPLLLTAHPQNQNVRLTSNVAFSVTVLSPEPPGYQWLFNNSPISGAISSNFTVSNVQLTDEGLYAVVVGNSYLSVTSNPAQLSVLITPVIIQPPLSQTVVAGGNVALSAVITGNPAPFGFQWRSGSTPLTTVVQTNRECFFNVSNVQASGIYSVVVTNAAAPTFAIAASCRITVLADTTGNALPDLWEQLYGVSDPLADPDQDLLTNLQEYWAATDPTNATSMLRLNGPVFQGGATILEFAAVSNKTYTVEHSDELPASSWRKLADTIARPTNRVERVVDVTALAGGKRFYRLLTPRRSE